MIKTSTRALIACTGAFLLSTVLVACGVFTALRSETRSSVPSPPNSPAPVLPAARHFDSDRAAEAAAMELLPRYFATLDEITTHEGARPDRIYPYVTPNMRSNLSLVFDRLHREKRSTRGSTRIVDEVFLRYSEDGGEAVVGERVCLAIGEAMVPAERSNAQPSARPSSPAEGPSPPGADSGLVSGQRVPYDVWLTTRKGEGNRLFVASTRGRRDLGPC